MSAASGESATTAPKVTTNLATAAVTAAALDQQLLRVCFCCAVYTSSTMCLLCHVLLCLHAVQMLL
jgi:hypothetical protein